MCEVVSKMCAAWLGPAPSTTVHKSGPGTEAPPATCSTGDYNSDPFTLFLLLFI